MHKQYINLNLFYIQGKTPEELPESLLGSIRLNNLDFKAAVRLDTSKEIDLV